MGRSIPSVTARLDSKLQEWSEFERQLNTESRQAYRELASKAKNFRASICESNEPDISIAMLLAMAVALKREINELKGKENAAFQTNT